MSNVGPFYANKARYLCEVTDQAIGKAGTGTPQIVIQFRVIEHEDGEPVEKQYHRKAYLYLTENSIERSAECLKGLGYNAESFKYLDKTIQGHVDLTGQRFVGYCMHEPARDGSGNMYEKWGISGGAAPLEVEPLESSALRDLDNLFGAHLKKNSGAKAVAAAGATPAPRLVSQPRQAPQPVAAGGPQPFGNITDDDIPF